MKNDNAKLKIIFLFLLVLFLAGCARNVPDNHAVINNNSKNTNEPEVVRKSPEPIKILFVGDMMFDRYIREGVSKYGSGDYDYVFAQIKDKLAEYDLVVGNLEGPITDKSSVSVGTAMDEKINLVFTFDPAVAKALTQNNIKLVDIGNNHILNQGEDGLALTKKYLEEAGVQYFGDTVDSDVIARSPSKSWINSATKQSRANDEIATLPSVARNDKIVNIGGTKIGFVNYNYSVAGSFERAVEDIKNIRNKSDVVVVCPHWGTEYKSSDPGQEIRSEAYELINAGADLIIGGHPHVVQTSETYKGKKIYYSLGNFIFDQYFQKETMEGLGVELTVNLDLSMEFNEVKFEMTKKGQTTVGY